MNFYLGCAVWSYRDWVGNLYPDRSRPQEFLNLYSRRFTTVEGNTTFYAIPSSETIAKWVAQTPVGFKFCPKMNRQVTHQGLLAPRIPEAIAFLTRMSELEDRLGTTFIQLPPSYSPDSWLDLQAFLIACSQSGFSLALEVRHLDWFSPQNSDHLNTLLAQLNIAKVLLDTRPIYNCPQDPQINSRNRKPQVPLEPILTTQTSFVRFISHPDSEYNQDYLEQWARDVAQWLKGNNTIYFLVHCPEEIYSPNTAKNFYTLLKRKAPQISTLPWDCIDPHPTQLNLF